MSLVCSWEGTHRSGTAPAMRHTLNYRLSGLSTPPTLLKGVRYSIPHLRLATDGYNCYCKEQLNRPLGTVPIASAPTIVCIYNNKTKQASVSPSCKSHRFKMAIVNSSVYQSYNESCHWYVQYIPTKTRKCIVLTSGESNLAKQRHRRRTRTVQSYSPGGANVHPI